MSDETDDAAMTVSDLVGPESPRVDTMDSGSSDPVAPAPEAVPPSRTGIGARFSWKGAAWGSLEIAVVVTCVLVVFFTRLIDLERIEVGGDALKVWEFARNIVLGGDFPTKLNHHTSRFGLVIPSILAQLFFGSQATSYFIGPLAAGVLLHVWVYLIGRKLSGPVAGAIGVVLLLKFEPMVRANSQILPEAFGPMFTTFAIYAALLFSEAETRFRRWVALCAVGLGIIFAYGAKENYLFFAPGVAFLVWFGGSKGPLLPEHLANAAPPGADAGRGAKLWHWVRTSQLVVPGALTAVVVGLVIIESIFLSSVTDASSRLEVVQGSHGGIGENGPRINEVADFFALYTRAPWEWTQAFTGGLVALLGLAAFARDKRARLIGLALFVFFMLQTFIVRRLSPLTPWTEPHPRYLLAMAGPMAIVTSLFIGEALDRLTRRENAGTPLVGRGRLLALTVSFLLLASGASALPDRYKAEWGRRDAVTQTRETAEQLTKAYKAGLPIVAETPQGKPAWAAAAVFIDPAVLKDPKTGKPLSSQQMLQRIGKGRYIARATSTTDISPYRMDNAVAHRVLRRKCAIVLRQTVRFMSGNLTFPSDCDSLEKEFKTDPKAGRSPPPKPSKRSRSPSRAR